MLWELWQLTVLELLLVATLGLLLWALALIESPVRLPSPARWPASATYQASLSDHVTVFALTFALMLPLLIFPRTGTGREETSALASGFVRPVRTSTLVLIPMLYLTGCATLLFVALMSIEGAVAGFDASLPSFIALVFLLSPIVVTLILVARGHGPATGPVRIGLVIVVGLGVLLALLRGQASLPLGWTRTFSLPAGGWVALVAVTAATIALAMAHVDRQRHRAEPRARRRTQLSLKAGSPGAGSPDATRWRCPTSSPAAAEIWRGMRALLPRGITVSGMAFVWAAGGTLMNDAARIERLSIMLVVIVLGTVGAGTLGVALESCARRLPILDATRPVTTAALAAYRIGAGAVVGLLSLMSLAALYFVVGPMLIEDFALFRGELLALLGSVPLPTLLFWTPFVLVQLAAVVSLCAALGGFYVRQPFLAVLAGVGAWMTVAISTTLAWSSLGYIFTPNAPADTMSGWELPLSVLLIFAGGIAAGVHVWRERLLTWQQAAGGLVAWVAYAGIYFAPIDPAAVYPLQLAPELAATWLLAMSLTPLVAFMLAVSALHLVRHR